MSHTYNREDFVFNYNSDLSGLVTITDKVAGASLKVRGSELVAFVANYVRRERIAQLEQMSDAEILGLKDPRP